MALNKLTMNLIFIGSASIVWGPSSSPSTVFVLHIRRPDNWLTAGPRVYYWTASLPLQVNKAPCVNYNFILPAQDNSNRQRNVYLIKLLRKIPSIRLCNIVRRVQKTFYGYISSWGNRENCCYDFGNREDFLAPLPSNNAIDLNSMWTYFCSHL